MCREEALVAVAEEVGEGLAVVTDVTKESEIQTLVERAENEVGPIDIFCSNAGIARLGDVYASNDEWQLNWDIHVMAHVYAARLVAPKMAARGDGYLVNTASAAGFVNPLCGLSDVCRDETCRRFLCRMAFHRIWHAGRKVSVLCPQAVRTAMTQGREQGVASVDGMIDPDELAECVVQTMEKEEFLILPHPVVLKYIQGKAGDYDRWLGGMRKLKERYRDNPGI